MTWRLLSSLAFALNGPEPAWSADAGRWVLHYLLWSGLGLAALVAAAYRHRDAR
ncbi:MAG TPA: hypothetical protein VF192_16285 [Longimicrobiales bacterium]